MDGWWWRKPMMLAPAMALALVAFGLGVYQPVFVRDALQNAASTLTWHGLPARETHAAIPHEVLP